MKFNESKESKTELINSLEDKLSASVVGSIGNTVIIFRANEDKDKRKYKI